MKSGLRWYDSLLVLAFFYLLVLQIQAIWPFTVDDMFISLRYAKNWAFGYGLLWNVGAPPVEGYSNFSFVVLGAIALLLKMNPILVLKYTGYLGLLLCTYCVFLISRLWCSARAALLPCVLLLLYKGQIIWAVSGLETSVYQAFLSATVYFLFRAMGYRLHPLPVGDVQPMYFLLAGVLLCFAGWTRPEAPAFMVLFLVLLCWDGFSSNKKGSARGIACFLLPLLLLYAPYFFWRWHYYGYLFPNSVYCKGFSASFAHLLDFNYLKLVAPIAVLSLPACIKAEDKRHYFLWLPSVVYLVMLREADPVVAFDNRLFLPAFVLLMPLVLQGIVKSVRFFYPEDRFLVLVCFFCVVLLLPKMTLAQYRFFSENPLKGEQLRAQVLAWMNTHLKAHDKVVVSDAGMIPYYSSHYIIDSYCLNNLAMAHSTEQQRTSDFCSNVFNILPKAIILTSLMNQNEILYTPVDSCLKTLLAQHKEYSLNQSFKSVNFAGIYQYEVYLICGGERDGVTSC